MLILPYFALVQNVGDPFTSLDNNWYREHWANDLIIAKECVEGQVYENAVSRDLARTSHLSQSIHKRHRSSKGRFLVESFYESILDKNRGSSSGDNTASEGKRLVG